MTPQQFTEWRERLSLRKGGAASVLGVSKNMPRKYEAGEAPIPLYVALACSALAMGLAPYGSTR